MTMLLFLACAHPVDVALTAAEVAPTMANAQPWDGPDNVPAEAKGAAMGILAQLDPSGQLGTAVIATAEALVQPDVSATAKYDPGDGGAASTLVLPTVSDTTSPTWALNPVTTFSRVTLGPRSTLSIVFVDKDVQADDLVGTVVLSPADLSRAERAGEPWVVDVSAQTSGQLKSVSVSVVASP